MHSKNRLLALVSTALVFALAFTGCVKKRGDMDSQSFDRAAGEEFKVPTVGALSAWSEISSGAIYKRTTNTITTGPVLKVVKNSEAENLTVEPEVDYIKEFNVVSYTSNDPYLEDNTDELADMLGEPGKTYGVSYEISPNYLVINKIVKEDEISTTEKNYSRKEGAEWIVPIGGYSISGFYNIVKALNDDGRPTNVNIRKDVPRIKFSTAQYFEINPASFTKFERQEKFDVLPKTFFDGEWYFSETTVEARLDTGTVVGDLGSSDAKFLSATRIIFKLQGSNLIGLNTNVDEEFKDDVNKLNYNTVIKIPIDHFDYRRFVRGADILKESTDDIKKPEERQFVKLNFLKSETPQGVLSTLLSSIFNQINNFKTLLDVTYGKDYLSFSVRDADSGSIKRYAFRKIDPNNVIKPRRAFREDNYLLGTFTTLKSKKPDFMLSLKEDADKLILMARHNPSKDIVYYFTDQTPKDDWHRNIGREAVNLWSQAFKRAGLKIDIKLNESKDVPLGDIRYNVLNIVKRAGAGLLGFGPSLIDSETGEIVSASMNMGMDNMLEQYYSVVRDYIGRKSGRYYNFKKDGDSTGLPTVLGLLDRVNKNGMYLDAKTGQMALMTGVGTDSSQTRLDASVFTDKEKEFLQLINLAPNASVKDFVSKVMDLKVQSYKYANMESPFNFQYDNQVEADFSSTQFTDGNIEEYCPEVVGLADRKKTEEVGTEEEVSIITTCVKMFAQADALTTVLHEMGHNLSMRHNFIGSADPENFPGDNNGNYTLKFMQIQPHLLAQKSSSVMDYLTMEGQQFALGGYDLATIRWIYNEEVEDKSGKIIKVDTTKRIAATIPEENLKAYKYCTDEQRILGTDPMCSMHDQGLTPKENVQHRIESAYHSLARLYRYDFINAGNTNPYYPAISIAVYTHTTAMKLHYDKWRFFLRRHTGLSEGYLQNMSAASYAKVLAQIAKNPADKKIMEDHLEVRNMIVNYLVDLAFISNKYCLVKEADSSQRLIELEKIRSELFGFGEFTIVTSCASPAVAKYFADNQLTLVKEFGHFLDAGTFDLDTSKPLESLDFAGTTSIRLLAMSFLTQRISPSWNNAKEGYYTSFLDEPDVRDYVKGLLLDRLTTGVRLGSLDNGESQYLNKGSNLFGAADLKSITDLPAYVNFRAETDIMKYFTVFTKVGLFIPGEPDDGRVGDMYVGFTQSQDEITKNGYPNYVQMANGFYFVRAEDSFAGKLMSKMQEVGQQVGLAEYVTPDTLVQAKAALTQGLAQVLPATEQVTYSDIVKIYSTVASVSKKLSDAKDPKNYPLLILLQSSFQVEMYIYNNYKTKLAQQGLDPAKLAQEAFGANVDPAVKAAAVQVLSESAVPAYAEIVAGGNPDVKAPTAANVAVRMDSFMVNYGQEYSFISKNNDELQAQSRGLLEILGAIVF